MKVYLSYIHNPYMIIFKESVQYVFNTSVYLREYGLGTLQRKLFSYANTQMFVQRV